MLSNLFYKKREKSNFKRAIKGEVRKGNKGSEIKGKITVSCFVQTTLSEATTAEAEGI